MAHRCKGIWKSWINPPNPRPAIPNDGEINVEPVDSAGNFEGKHLNSNKLLKEGKCTKGQKHTIDFKREEGNKKYHYKGEITQEVILGAVTDVVRNGTCKITSTAETKTKGQPRSLADDDEVWQAEKTT